MVHNYIYYNNIDPLHPNACHGVRVWIVHAMLILKKLASTHDEKPTGLWEPPARSKIPPPSADYAGDVYVHSPGSTKRDRYVYCFVDPSSVGFDCN